MVARGEGGEGLGKCVKRSGRYSLPVMLWLSHRNKRHSIKNVANYIVRVVLTGQMVGILMKIT